MAGVNPKDSPENLGYACFASALPTIDCDTKCTFFRLPDFSADTVQPRISYTYLQGLAQVLGSDFITVFFSESFVFGEYKTDSPSKPAALVSFILRHP